MTRFVTLGPSTIDIYYTAAAWPGLGDKAMITDRTLRIGGMIANTAAALAAAGQQVVHLERIGTNHADEVLASLARFGVDTSLVQVGPTARTCEAYVVRVGGERTILIDDDGREVLDVTPSVTEVLAAADVVVTSPHELRQPSLRAAVFAAHAGGTRIAMDIESAGLADPELDAGSVLKSSFLVINASAAAAVGLDLRELARGDRPQAGDAGAGRDIIVTRGAQGVDIVGPDADVRVPAITIDAVDTTGASDTFFAAYLARRCAGASATDAARFAVTAAGQATARVGPRAGAEYLATLTTEGSHV
jgi:ribokinase